MTRIFKYLDQEGEHAISEGDIIRTFYQYWAEKMEKVGKLHLVNFDNCIEDWCVVHWAEEVKEAPEQRVPDTTRRLTFNRFPSPMPKRALVKGRYYVGVCRNANIARWDGNYFWYWRVKFGHAFVENIKHREDDDVFDVFDAWMPVDDREVAPIPVEGL